MRTAISAVIIKERKILLVKKEEFWILPGGKPEPEESDLDCLCREVREELSGTELKNVRYYGEFEGITPRKGYLLKAKVYFAEIISSLGLPAAEISAREWVDDTGPYKMSDITAKIIDSLRKDQYL
ncbi:MAG: NUDIX domain-containing protein [Nanoarchaeota archaeon]